MVTIYNQGDYTDDDNIGNDDVDDCNDGVDDYNVFSEQIVYVRSRMFERHYLHSQ